MTAPHRRLAASALIVSGCATSIYVPAPLPPAEGWVSACAEEVDATVVVENTRDAAVEVHELRPDHGCTPRFRATVAAGETADVGAASGPIWRVYDEESREWLGTFVLEDGQNVLVVP